jgi:hypothetical protein
MITQPILGVRTPAWQGGEAPRQSAATLSSVGQARCSIGVS